MSRVLSSKNILVAHAWRVCDTTSPTYGHGTSKILKYVKKKKIKNFERSAKYSRVKVSVI